MNHHFLRVTAIVVALVSSVDSANADPVIWDGPRITFTKASGGDWMQEESQDRITDDVWITRADTRGLFNASTETFQSDLSPTGTEWAPGTTADLESLTFEPWLAVFGLSGPFAGPPYTVGEDFVLHLIDEDIYIDLQILSWDDGFSFPRGGFSYSRTTPPTMGGLDGDYNEDGVVDSIDYAVWREDLGGEFDSSDFTTWINNYGASSPGAGAIATPEPATGILALLIGVCLMGSRRLKTRS